MRRYLALAIALAMVVAFTPSDAVAGGEIPFDEAELYFELNNTDGDLGIHGLVDGDPWQRVGIEGPGGLFFMEIRVRDELKEQGMTEFFFESHEPTFDELPPAEFFARFPAGIYELEGRTLEGEELESEVVLSHVMPAPAGNVLVNDQPAAEDCDAVLPVVSDPVMIRWDPVTTHHPEIGESGEVEIDAYQLVVESDNVELSVNLPSHVTEFQVPSEILALEDELKFEILVRDSTHNQVGVESCFVVE